MFAGHGAASLVMKPWCYRELHKATGAGLAVYLSFPILAVALAIEHDNPVPEPPTMPPSDSACQLCSLTWSLWTVTIPSRTVHV